MKMISWNVNGIRACLKKGFLDFVKDEKPDVLCLQEIKAMKAQVDPILEKYYQFWNSANKKGYSGTAIFSKEKPIKVNYGINIEEHDKEGRVITAEYKDKYLVNVYTPNSKRGLLRLSYRQKWDTDFRLYCKQLETKKPVVICGDLNVAHKEIDLKNPKSNHKNPGFSPQEREGFDNLVSAGFTDTFRHFNQEPGNYTWWSYMFKARVNNVGWRIDYFVTSEILKKKLKDATILNHVHGSDHCPVTLTLK